VYLLYVDESGDTGVRGSSHLILAGAALFDGKWRRVRGDLGAILEKHFPSAADRPREFHASEVRKGRGPYSRLEPAQRDGLTTDVCALVTGLKQSEVCLFAIIVDKAWWFARNPGKTGDDLYVEMFENLVSRFDFFLRRLHHEGRTSKGLIIADPRHEAFCRALKAAVARFHAVGTKWAALENVIETVLFIESHESPGVQLADLASYAVWRLVDKGDDSLGRSLQHCFDRESLVSAKNRGKWHGLRFYGPASSVVRSRVATLWP
jgi:hypothetical protein